MKLHPLAAAIVAVALSPAAPAQTAAPSAAQPGAAEANRASLSTQDRAFMRNAKESGWAEIAASRMAVQQATDPAVMEFAQRMAKDHLRVDQQLEELARNKGVRLPAVPSTVQQEQVDQLRAVTGQAFDRRYLEQFGTQAHRKAIELYRKEAQQGRDRDVREFARATLPTLQQHLQMAQNLYARFEPGRGNPYAASGASRDRRQDSDRREELQDARHDIMEAVQVVQRMKADPGIARLLERAKGVFILPDYGRGGFGVGVQGGEGVLVTRKGSGFSEPVFYNMGGISIGAQAGASGGELAFLLMTDKAVRDFESGKNFSLNADAGLTIVNYSKRAQVSGGKVQDVIVWSNTKGAYAGASVAITDIVVDGEANRAYYGRDSVTPAEIIQGRVQNPHSNVLGKVLGA